MFDRLPSVLTRDLGDVESEALFVVDTTNGTLSYVNSVAAASFGLEAQNLGAVRAGDLVAELADLRPRTFTSAARTASGERRVDVAIEALTGGSGAVLVTLRALDLLPMVVGERRASKRSERLESLWLLVVRRGLVGAEQVRAILREVIRGLGVEHVVLARVERDELVTDFADDESRLGERLSIEASLGGRAVAGAGTFAVLDTTLDLEYSALVSEARSFLSSCFRIGDQRYVLTCSSDAPRRRPFSEDDWEYLDNVVEAVARALERRDNDARIERLAYVDALTTLPNRSALYRRLDDALQEAARAGSRAAVLFLDVDGFKGVNDTVGHRGGDTVLAEIAQRLRGTLRRDEYIGRLGGDEFAIVMPCIAERGEIEAIAQRIAGVLTFPFAVDGYRFALSASIGVAVYPDDATGRDDLLACADAAMYVAKENGGGRVLFCNVAGAPKTAFAVRVALPSGAETDGYRLCYQPILDLRTGRVSAAEALIRRAHPVHGLLAPESGWSIAQDEAGRRALDHFVLREATVQARAWNESGTPMRIDVNLAAYDAAEIEELAREFGPFGDTGHVRIELSPRQFEGGEAAVARFIDRCAENGIGFALDGFDGGLGLLPSLSHLPIDALKLERGLIETISLSRTARAIVEGSIVVARALGWSVIAKGVETDEQHDVLLELGCDAVQGFLVAHPMPAADFARWLRERGVAAERPA
jgi:diguanylate cyclase (GGDEF)-like protein